MVRLLQRLMSSPGWMRAFGFLFGRYNPWLPDHRRDPYRFYQRLREEAPIYRHPILRMWIVSRYDDAVEVLRDPRFSADRSQLALMKITRWLVRRDPDFLGLIDRNLLNLEGPDHSRVRSLVNKAFTPRRVAALRPRIEALVDELLESAAERGDLELVRDLAHPLPVIVIAELLGIPASDRERFRVWSEAIVQILDPLSGEGGLGPARRASRELAAYFRGMLEARRREPQDDLLSAMLGAEQDGNLLGEADLLALCALILAAGHETTANLIGNAVLALLRHPEERKRLQDDPGLIGSAIEEFLRYDSPVQLTERVVAEDFEFRGVSLRRGQLVWPLLGSANRDPERFPDPDRLDQNRADNRHLAFGHGAHFCLGAPLARLEAEIALGALLRCFPEFDGAPEAIRWKRSVVLRGPVALPLKI
jgi:cytochrome P450